MRWLVAFVVGIGWTAAWMLSGRMLDGPAAAIGVTLAYFAGLVGWLAIEARHSGRLPEQMQPALALAFGVAVTVGTVTGFTAGQDSSIAQRVFGAVLFAVLAELLVMSIWSVVVAAQHIARKARAD